MSKKLGDIDYNENEYLNCSANYEKPEENKKVAGKVELDIIDLAEEMEETETEAEEIIEKNEIEARFNANRANEIHKTNNGFQTGNSNYIGFGTRQTCRKSEK